MEHSTAKSSTSKVIYVANVQVATHVEGSEHTGT